MVQSALFHDCLDLSFWLNVPIIARMGSLFYVTISVDSVLLSFPKLVKIHNGLAFQNFVHPEYIVELKYIENKL